MKSLLELTPDEAQQVEDVAGVPFGELLQGGATSVAKLKAEWFGLARTVEPDLTVQRAKMRLSNMTILEIVKGMTELAKQLPDDEEVADDGDVDP